MYLTKQVQANGLNLISCCKSVFIYSYLLVARSSPEITVSLSLPMRLIDAKRESLLVLINCTNNIKITVTGISVYAKCAHTNQSSTKQSKANTINAFSNVLYLECSTSINQTNLILLY